MQPATDAEVVGGAVKQEPEEIVVAVDGDEEVEAEKVVKRRRRKKKTACDPHKKRACVDCTKRCARIHGRPASASALPSSSNARPVPAVPSFFKVMMGYFSEDMDIPPPFARTIWDLAGSNIFLEDAFGLRWRVRLCLRDGVLSFGHGWKNFVLDHAVSCGEFLVFRQIARSVFTVQMFAPSAVERLYLCEKNKRQSRKRKPRQKTSSPSIQTAKKVTKNSVKNCKKRQRTDDHQNGMRPRGRKIKMAAEVCIDDSDVPDSVSELKCSDASERVPEAGAAEPQEISEAPAGHECEAQEVLDGEAEIADDSTMLEENESNYNAISASIVQVSAANEIEHGEGLNLPTDFDASVPLAMMDLNEVSIDDIFLSADIYEFESDMCNPESFSVDLNMEGPITTGQNSGFSCLEDTPQNHLSSMGDGHRSLIPEAVLCIENKEMTDALGTGTSYFVDSSVHDIDINALPANEPPSFGEDNSSPQADAEMHSNECGLSSCNKDKRNSLLPLVNKQAAHKEYSSMTTKQDAPQSGQCNMQDGIGRQHATEIMSRSAKPHELPDLRQNPLQTGNGSESIHRVKFCIDVPAPGQTWLELPGRLPVLPRTKKHGRKVVILKDPCMRLWPVLYQCTPRFNGFITGWVDICRENSLQEGDTCEFELSGNSELSFKLQVRVPNTQ
ncbi:B3 domain-containing protein Os01g0905400-like isoform X2 [Miscanthus floridulus]|uniref:B3 domain-containing protein Os01g0905400-like isoform X2 n=1 Tax=Miscanthus floridulus TaxID=154761 RepID=UPI0034590C60